MGNKSKVGTVNSHPKSICRNDDIAVALREAVLGSFSSVVIDAAIGVEQGAMGRGVDESTLVVLAVDFNERGDQLNRSFVHQVIHNGKNEIVDIVT